MRQSIHGGFDMGECFCDVRCVHGHVVRLFSIGRERYVACDICRAFIHVGGNLMSAWRQENADAWEDSRQSIKGHKRVGWITRTSPGRSAPIPLQTKQR